MISIWDDTQERLAPETKIWRYIKLSTLLSMINGRVFIPKLSLLQSDDKNESKVTTQADFASSAERSNVAQTPNYDWLLDRSTWQRRLIECNQDASATYELLNRQSLLEDIWLQELAKRRCIWCWHESHHESMAQWRIYAKDGIAIRSSVGKVCSLLENKIGDGVFGRVRYLHRSPQSRPLEDCPKLIWHPYFAKQSSYEHEKEIRFVFRDDNIRRNGCSIPCNIESIVEEIRISPYLLTQEAIPIKEQLVKLLPEQLKTRIAVSPELSEELCPIEDYSSGERWTLKFWQPSIDDELPPILQELPKSKGDYT